jgi:hypothetical protein
MGPLIRSDRPSCRGLAEFHCSHPAIADCTVQVVGMLPTAPVDDTAVPFMNQIDVLPLVSRQNRSLMPSPLN